MRNYFSSRRIRETFLTKVKDLPPSYSPTRGGAIPIVRGSDGRVMFGLGVDSIYNQLTDFSGGIKHKETFLQGALREFQEETLGIFGTINPEDIQNCLVIHNHQMFLILLPFDVSIEDCNQAFAQAYSRYPSCRRPPEISRFEWLDHYQLQNLVENGSGVMYEKVRNFLFDAPPFFALL